MADGQPGAPRKYTGGFARLDMCIPLQLDGPLTEFCKKHNIQKTDVVAMAINFVIKPENEREAELVRAGIKYESMVRELEQRGGEIIALRETIESLRARQSFQKVRSVQADKLMHLSGEHSQTGLTYRADKLRPFLRDSTVPDEQKQEIAAFINRVNSRMGGAHE